MFRESTPPTCPNRTSESRSGFIGDKMAKRHRLNLLTGSAGARPGAGCREILKGGPISHFSMAFSMALITVPGPVEIDLRERE